MMDSAIRSGRALTKFEQIISAQGGDTRVATNPERLPQARHRADFAAKRDGVVQMVDPRAVGYGVIELGGGRRNMEDKVDTAVGFVITAKPGDRVQRGETLATIHARTKDDLEVGRASLDQAISISDAAATSLPLLSHRITAGGVENLV